MSFPVPQQGFYIPPQEGLDEKIQALHVQGPEERISTIHFVIDQYNQAFVHMNIAATRVNNLFAALLNLEMSSLTQLRQRGTRTPNPVYLFVLHTSRRGTTILAYNRFPLPSQENAVLAVHPNKPLQSHLKVQTQVQELHRRIKRSESMTLQGSETQHRDPRET